MSISNSMSTNMDQINQLPSVKDYHIGRQGNP